MAAEQIAILSEVDGEARLKHCCGEVDLVIIGWGAQGEAAHGPVTAAIANAVFDALELRVRNLPITRDRLIAAMELAS